MSIGSGNSNLGEEKSELHRIRTMRKHETMRDDYYQKKYRDMRRRSPKVPVWLSLLVYALAILLIYALFYGGSG